MTRRSITSLAMLALAAAAGSMLTAAAAQAPAPAASDKPWTLPRTPDGKPDLQGTWSNATLTPLERPAGQALALTAEQAAQIENRTQQVKDFRDQPSDPNRPAPAKGGEERALPPGEPTFIERLSASAGGRVGGYNNFWLDPGERVLRIDGEPRSAHGDRSRRRTCAAA